MLKSLLRSGLFLVVGSIATSVAFNCSSRPAVESGRQFAEQVFLPGAAGAESVTLNGASIADVAERVVPSVVNISTEKVVKRAQQRTPFDDPFFRQFFGDRLRRMPPERRERSLGSGVIVDPSGVILTNNHVIEGATEIRVTLSDGREFAAENLGTDPESDVAVLKLKDKVKDLRALPFGDAEGLRLGDIVLAVGNPFGVGQTVTMGIVSAKGRANVGIVDYEDFIQTDAAINPGNSGGALVNGRGELVGINTAILSRSGGYQGIGFAIPSNMAQSIMSSLLEDGKVTRGFLGISIQDVDRNLADALGLKDTRGVLVGGVADGSPAEGGGIRAGDVILSVSGKEVSNTGELRNAVALAGAGTTVALAIMRDGKARTLKVKLGEKPGARDAVSSGPEAEASTEKSAGLTLGRLDEQLRARLRLSDSVEAGAVVILGVEANSPAARAGLRRGDVIRKVAGVSVKSPEDFRRALESEKAVIPVLLQRGELTQFVALKTQ